MRFLDLRLIAIGHFTDATLHLKGDIPGGLHLIYGRNEAGKSTTLRAIRYLLFGFPERTSDNFLHPKPRVGARLALDQGPVDLIRRKGRKRTLLDLDESEVSEQLLRGALRGVSEEQFQRMFGLDHTSLRDGGRALLEGSGSVGESLFDAGTGGRAIHRVLAALDAEADSLFRPRGKRKLNEAIDQYREAVHRTRERGIEPEAARKQRDKLEAARQAKAHLDSQLRELRLEQDRTKRSLAMLPRLRQRRQLLRKLEVLGPTLPFRPEDRQEREALSRQLEEAQLAQRQNREEEARLSSQLAEVEPGGELAALTSDLIGELEDQRGSHRKAILDRPKRLAELRAAKSDLRGALDHLGPRGAAVDPEDPDAIAALRVATDRAARVRALAEERGALLAKVEAAEAALAETEAGYRSAGRRLDQAPRPLGDTPTQALQAALDAWELLGDVDSALAGLEQETGALSERTARRSRELLRLTDEPSDPLALVVPSEETVDRYRRDVGRVEAAREKVLEAQDAAAQERDEIAAKLDSLAQRGDLPTEEALERIRADRNRSWGVIRRAVERLLEETRPAKASRRDGKRSLSSPKERLEALQGSLGLERPDPSWFDGALRQADALADRLRREAQRVAEHAELTAARRRLDRRLGEMKQRSQDLDDQSDSLRRQWSVLWEEAGISPRPPEEMLGWLARFRDLTAQLETLNDRRRQLEALRDRRGRASSSLEAGLEAAGVVAPPTGAKRRQAASEALRRSELARTEARHLEERASELEARTRAHEQELERQRLALQAWTQAWAKTVAPLGLSGSALPQEAQAVLEQIDRVLKHADDVQQLERRIQGIDRDEQSFRSIVSPLVEAHAPDLRALPIDEQSQRLVERHRAAAGRDRRRAELQESLQVRRVAEETLRQQVDGLEERLTVRLEAAGAGSLLELREAEAKGEEAQQLRRELTTEEEALESLAEGERLADAEARLADADAAALRVRLADLEHELPGVEEERDNVAREIGALEHGIEDQRTRSQASQAAADAQFALTTVREQGHRVVRLKLAAALLRREVDRYRADHQGPVLRRASDLFPRLTLERYQGLKVGFGANDEEVIRCVRADGEEIAVEALSDGAQDQLYLALRLASLEHHQRRVGPLPLVLDDILIHFDEDRAKAALEVLGDFAGQCQVLFFTHQARLRELAQEVVPASRLDVLDLDQASASGEAWDGQPLAPPAGK